MFFERIEAPTLVLIIKPFSFSDFPPKRAEKRRFFHLVFFKFRGFVWVWVDSKERWLFLKVAEAMQVEKIGAFGTRNPSCCLSPPPFSMKSDGFLGNASAERNSFLSISSLFLSRSARKKEGDGF